MCGAFRLARFNLQATRPRVLAEGAAKIDKRFFVGLPIPPAGGLLAAIVHYSPSPLITFGVRPAHYYAYALLALVATLGILMVSTIRYTSFKASAKGRAGFYLVLFFALIGMLIWLYSEYVLLAMATVYVMHGLLWWLIRPIFVRPSAA
jgi:CDP-diacylglycerol--serine O-phosphatidyltransferase